ncbi:YbaK/EbsC family protein [Celeribacter neptunius]|uniref:Cys-tRNA(Pro) deacylase, prolyl-tRNA editing enzyme YbaK/EbsC n=1 Tax=Celeribacter neptunius TaxID=588602 RepID=A0A1I3LY59_9RHOB|nr:YbaK/EbsC family protein [Celeribacter neptunius]SFI89721.1 Cys-tRNA(Pro) deacylase, prolyl-tRNA editing enzyme YbaK/EbsC [Celeribacter neptunius]
MSKSLKRVERALSEAGLDIHVLEMDGSTRTAAEAADQAGCALDQIAKSIVFKGAESGAICVFITAGGDQVDVIKAAEVAGEPLERADGKEVRKVTGFAIGGVSPVGHLSPPHAFFDPKLLEFDTVWAAAGTPRHIFEITPRELLRISGAREADFTA